MIKAPEVEKRVGTSWSSLGRLNKPGILSSSPDLFGETHFISTTYGDCVEAKLPSPILIPRFDHKVQLQLHGNTRWILRRIWMVKVAPHKGSFLSKMNSKNEIKTRMTTVRTAMNQLWLLLKTALMSYESEKTSSRSRRMLNWCRKATQSR